MFLSKEGRLLARPLLLEMQVDAPPVLLQQLGHLAFEAA